MKSLALNMLVWNDEDLLPYALNSVMPYVQEAHIIDTGSTDNTLTCLLIAQGLWPKLEVEIIDVQHLGKVWTGSKKDNELTKLLNRLKEKTRSDYIIKVDSDEVFPKKTMDEIIALEPTKDFYSLYFRHFEKDGMLDPTVHKKLWALRIFRNLPDIWWTGRYGTETITKNGVKIPVKKGKFLYNPFLHFGGYRKDSRRHEYKYDSKDNHFIPPPMEYQKYVPHNS